MYRIDRSAARLKIKAGIVRKLIAWGVKLGPLDPPLIDARPQSYSNCPIRGPETKGPT
jgi:hypothetical protein